jgi:hypothetical protein
MAVRNNIAYRDPHNLLVETELAMRGIPSEKLFNDPMYKKLRERWCAAMFGIGYSKHVRSCEVAVNESRYREDVDFYVGIADVDWDFQLAEVQRPDRRRGQEYRKLADGGIHMSPYQPGRGGQEGPDWLAHGVDKKIARRYSSSNTLNLLVYANFDATGLEYPNIQMRLAEYSVQFGSLWVITSLHMCSVFSNPSLGAVPGWGVVRDVHDYYPPVLKSK